MGDHRGVPPPPRHGAAATLAEARDRQRDLVFYVLRAGCPWRMLPEGVAPGSTVYRWFVRLRDSGVFATINRHLLKRDRGRSGREANPSAAVIDSQSVKSTQREHEALDREDPIGRPVFGRLGILAERDIALVEMRRDRRKVPVALRRTAVSRRG